MDFDRILDCRGTDSLKYDCAAARGKPEGLLPMWVADMDFAAPQPVLDALEARARQGVFGYSETGEAYFNAVAGWFARRFGWQAEPDWLVKTPGIVLAICAAIQAFTREGEAVLIQEPVYYPFRESVELNNRRLVVNELVMKAGRYEIDFDDFERRVRDDKVKLFLLCSPHNPGGRVWTGEELRRMAAICLRYDVLVLSDEIHADLVLGERPHLLLAQAEEKMRDRLILCTAPSKTFNIAGLQVSNIFIPNPALRRAFRRQVDAFGYSQLNTMGLLACRVAYEQGEQWLEELLAYLRGNLAYLREQVFPLTGIKMVEPEATYLLWMDCRELGLTDTEIEKRMLEKAGLWLDGGTMFGPSGTGYQRLNIAYPRAVLEQAGQGLIRAFPK